MWTGRSVRSKRGEGVGRSMRARGAARSAWRRARWLCLLSVTGVLVGASPASASITSAALTRGSGTHLVLMFNESDPYDYVQLTLPAGSAASNVNVPACQATGNVINCNFTTPQSAPLQLGFDTASCLSSSASARVVDGVTVGDVRTHAAPVTPPAGDCSSASPPLSSPPIPMGEMTPKGGHDGGSIFAVTPESAGGGVSVTVTVPKAGTAIHATLSASAKAVRAARMVKLGKAVLTNLPAGRTTFKVSLNGKGRKALKRVHKLTVTLRVVFIAPDGATSTATKKVRLKR
jgi:hypothetical protein